MGDEQHLPGVEPVTGQVLRMAENPLDAFNIVFYIIVSQFYKYITMTNWIRTTNTVTQFVLYIFLY
jgi:hypothetical protein